MTEPGTLFLVATPLGNLDDLSLRAQRTLAAVAVVYAEDTRRTRGLFEHFGIHKPLKSLHEHNERHRADEVLALLQEGQSVAVVSDAGTPGVSDPGALLVAMVSGAGVPISPIPGPSALAAALSVSGFTATSSDVWFVGFLPAKGEARHELVRRIGGHAGVVVLYEAPHRLQATLAELAAVDGDRRACLCRELTKLHEEVRHASVATLAIWAAGEVRGEITVVLGPRAEEPEVASDLAVDQALTRCLGAGLSARDASTAVAAVMEVSRRQVYARCQKLRQTRPGAAAGAEGEEVEHDGDDV
ncbi:MAG: 16S rRNA (cytidine(1402)-2'-O)-methyltransferase [Deltaproteobacteria bacterium]|nr:16S rRNA (cytidine(1402)-2'-O)-methyltransferase [Deltaproteobacteria bacterium]